MKTNYLMTYVLLFFFLMKRRTPRSTQAFTLFPYTTLFRSPGGATSVRSQPSATTREAAARRSEEHTSELQSRTLIAYAVFCLKKKKDRTASHRARWRQHSDGLLPQLQAPRRQLCQGDRPLFFFNDTATTEIYTSVHTLSLPDALPISGSAGGRDRSIHCGADTPPIARRHDGV